jgi:hypothetical protein
MKSDLDSLINYDSEDLKTLRACREKILNEILKVGTICESIKLQHNNSIRCYGKIQNCPFKCDCGSCTVCLLANLSDGLRDK